MRRSGKAVFAVVVGMGVVLASQPATGSIAQPRVVSADPANFTPNVIDGGGVTATSVDALAQLGTTLYAGGNFRLVQSGGTTYNRTHLMSFNATTGAMNSSAPTFDGKVFALLAHRRLLVCRRASSATSTGSRDADSSSSTRSTGAVDTAFNAAPERRGPGDPAGQWSDFSSAGSSPRSSSR